MPINCKKGNTADVGKQETFCRFFQNNENTDQPILGKKWKEEIKQNYLNNPIRELKKKIVCT